MSQPYACFPAVAALSIAERTKLLRKNCLLELQNGLDPDELLAAVNAVLAQEQYELAQAIVEAVQQFQQRPQLGLFGNLLRLTRP